MHRPAGTRAEPADTAPHFLRRRLRRRPLITAAAQRFVALRDWQTVPLLRGSVPHLPLAAPRAACAAANSSERCSAAGRSTAPALDAAAGAAGAGGAGRTGRRGEGPFQKTLRSTHQLLTADLQLMRCHRALALTTLSLLVAGSPPSSPAAGNGKPGPASPSSPLRLPAEQAAQARLHSGCHCNVLRWFSRLPPCTPSSSCLTTSCAFPPLSTPLQ